MKKITLLFLFLTVSLGYSQVVLEDFEGAAPTVDLTNGLGSATITTDRAAGPNGNVLEIISASTGDPWQQADLIMQNNLIDLTTTKTVDVDIYSTTAINILARGEDKVFNTAPVTAADMMHNGTGWETLTFNFNDPKDGQSAANGQYSQISFFTCWVGNNAGNNGDNNNWNDATSGITFYVDNITAVAGTALPIPTCTDGIQNQGETGVDCGGPCAACPVPPTTPAPTPPARPAADVVSIYSDAYTTGITFDAFDANWCGSPAYTEVMISGNNTLQKSAGIECHGINFESDRQDLSGFTHLHFDFYTTDTDLVGDVFNTKLVDWGFAPTNASQTALEVLVNTGTNPAIVANTWISVDMDITSLGGSVFGNLTRTDVAEFGITTAFVDNVWYDNIYLHKNTLLSTEDFNKITFNVYPNPTQNNWTIKTANVQMETISVFDVLGKQVLTLSPDDSEVKVDASNLKSGLYFAQIKTEAGINSIKLIKE